MWWPTALRFWLRARISSFQNKVHLAMEAKGFVDAADDEEPGSE